MFMKQCLQCYSISMLSICSVIVMMRAVRRSVIIMPLATPKATKIPWNLEFP